MRFVLYTQRYSPHELPLVRACAQVFDEVWYAVDRGFEQNPSRKAWQPDLNGLHTLILDEIPSAERSARLMALLDRDTVIMYGSRGNPYEIAIQESAAIVIYISERWLKPYKFVPGIFHLVKPSFVKHIINHRRWLRSNQRFSYFGLGIHAVRDMAFLTGMGRVSGFEKVPAGEVRVGKKPLSKIRLWGYFVEPSANPLTANRTAEPQATQPKAYPLTTGRALRVLWVGRMLDWKRVDTLIRAVAEVAKQGMPIACTIVGSGPEEARLKKLANSIVDLQPRPVFTFLPFVPIAEVRQLMREHDIYVLPSNSGEGWGAVVNEALEESMTVLCSREAGSGATMLSDECLFKSGDYRGLAEKLRTVRVRPGIGVWTPQEAATRLRSFVDDL